MKGFSITREEYEEIKKAEKETKDKNISRRLRVLMLRYEGYAVAEIAEMTEMRVNSISQLCRRYQEQGLEESKRNKYRSHRQSLPVEKEQEILSRFEKAAEQGQTVTAAEIKAAFDKEIGKDTGHRYAFGAVEPSTGKHFFWVLPRCDTICMNFFLSELSKSYPNDRILLVCDGASWHKSKGLVVPDNITLLHIPPYTSEMNPIEQIWKQLRSMGFKNEVFRTLECVVDRLCVTIRSLTHEMV